MEDYDVIAKHYDDYGKGAITDWTLGYQNVARILMPLNGKIILDYGCGTGQFSRHLALQASKVIGVDIHENMIRAARGYANDNIEYRHISSGDLDFIASNSIDEAALNFVTCTIGSETAIRRIFEEIHRVLKIDGTIIVMNANRDRSNGREFISFKLNYAEDLSSGRPVTVTLKHPETLEITDYHWSRQDYLRMLTNTGFIIKSIEEPTAMEDGTPWIDEKEFPPFLIIVAKKHIRISDHL